jgi:hypothetical protein
MSADYISVHNASRHLNRSPSMVRRMCEAGVFASAHKPGMGQRGWWLILKSEVLKHKLKRHPNPQCQL